MSSEIHGRPDNISLVLMAAAVPVSTVAPGWSLRLATTGLARSVVLFSPDDRALKIFPAFHGRARPGEGSWPEAVGLHGQPMSQTWTDTPEVMGSFDHSDYWLSKKVAKRIVSVIESEPSDRDIGDRGLPETPEQPARPLFGREYAMPRRYLSEH